LRPPSFIIPRTRSEARLLADVRKAFADTLPTPHTPRSLDELPFVPDSPSLPLVPFVSPDSSFDVEEFLDSLTTTPPTPTLPPSSVRLSPSLPMADPMPLPHSAKAPRFSSTPTGFDEFFEDVVELARRAGLGDADTIKWALRYAGTEGDAWRYVPCMTVTNAAPTFAVFLAAVRQCYPHLTADRRYTNRDLENLLTRTANIREMSRDEFGDYYRRFLTYTSYLIANRRLSVEDRNMDYLRGFPPDVSAKITHRLSIKKPDVVPDDGYDFNDIQEAASFVFSSASRKSRGTPDASVKAEPADSSMVELVRAMSDLTRVFTASMQNQQAPPPPPPPRFPRLPNAQPTPGGVVQNPPRWTQPNSDQFQQNCMFCSAQDHFVRNCPVASQYLQQGKVIRNDYGKLSLPDGTYVPRNVPGKNMRERLDNFWTAQGMNGPSENTQEAVATNFLEGPDECVFALDIAPQSSQSTSSDEGAFDQVQLLQAQIDSLRDAQVLALQKGRRQQFDGVEIMKRTGPPRKNPPPPPPTRDAKLPPVPGPTQTTPASGKPGARAGERPQMRPQGPMRPVSFPQKPAPDDPKYRYQAPIESNVKTTELADRALDAQITISTRELLAASADIRRCQGHSHPSAFSATEEFTDSF
jgi:hypothetical protein